MEGGRERSDGVRRTESVEVVKRRVQGAAEVRVDVRSMARVRCNAVDALSAGVMPSGQHLLWPPTLMSPLQETAELDMSIAVDVRVGCAVVRIASEEVLEDVEPVVTNEVGLLQLDAEVAAYGGGVCAVLGVRAGGVGLVQWIPGVHVHGMDAVAGLEEEEE